MHEQDWNSRLISKGYLFFSTSSSEFHLKPRWGSWWHQWLWFELLWGQRVSRMTFCTWSSYQTNETFSHHLILANRLLHKFAYATTVQLSLFIINAIAMSLFPFGGEWNQISFETKLRVEIVSDKDPCWLCLSCGRQTQRQKQPQRSGDFGSSIIK